MLEQIEALDAQKKAIAARFADPTFYETATQKDQDKLVWEDKELGESIEELTAEWETLEQEIAELSAG